MRFLLLVLALLIVPLAVLAQVVPSPEHPDAFVNAILAAVQGGNWRSVAILAVIGVVWAARRFGSGWVPWLATVRGGALLAIAGGLVSTLAPALLAGEAVTLLVILNGIINGIAAAGGWVVARRLVYGEGVPPNPAPAS